MIRVQVRLESRRAINWIDNYWLPILCFVPPLCHAGIRHRWWQWERSRKVRDGHRDDERSCVACSCRYASNHITRIVYVSATVLMQLSTRNSSTDSWHTCALDGSKETIPLFAQTAAGSRTNGSNIIVTRRCFLDISTRHGRNACFMCFFDVTSNVTLFSFPILCRVFVKKFVKVPLSRYLLLQ